jgi:hypothetical protein
MNYSQQADKLAGPIGLLKQYVSFPKIHSKSLKFPGLYLGLDGKQQKVKLFLSFYSLPLNSFFQSQTLPRFLVDELSQLPGWVN